MREVLNFESFEMELEKFLKTSQNMCNEGFIINCNGGSVEFEVFWKWK
jgi:hypothetical protein